MTRGARRPRVCLMSATLVAIARRAEAAFMEMRTRRMMLVPQARGQIDQLKKYCASNPQNL